jgi:tetratricopeptide (TPR) repeat protein
MPKAKRESGVRLEQVGPHEWIFVGADVPEDDLDRFDDAIELLAEDPARAERAFRALVGRNPGAIDLRHHLAIALKYQDRSDEALEQWTRAAGAGIQALPPEFVFGRDRLEWGWLQNRPFLRAYHGVALALEEEGMLGEAQVIFNNILDVNPNDNQGVRMTLARCSFALRRPGDVLRVCERYPEDGPDLRFGKALALFQLGQEREAEAAYRIGAQACPHVHQELLKTRHTRPKETHPGYITVGGADEAFAYWEAYGEFWKSTPGALAMAGRAPAGDDLAAKRARKVKEN